MYALIDCRAGEASLSALEKYGFTPILIPPARYLDIAVASHTDMLIFIGLGRLFCHADYYDRNKELIERILFISKLELMLSNEKTGDKYPLDVLFNACLIKNRLICNKKTVSSLILATAEAYGIEIIDVPQGYTKCSICPVGNDAILTSDSVIATACRKHGMNVLLISRGHISLPPYEYGFVGGASGYCEGKVYFCGSLNTHPDGDKMKKFCTQNGAEIIELSNEILQDVGTIFFI